MVVEALGPLTRVLMRLVVGRTGRKITVELAGSTCFRYAELGGSSGKN